MSDSTKTNSTRKPFLRVLYSHRIFVYTLHKIKCSAYILSRAKSPHLHLKAPSLQEYSGYGIKTEIPIQVVFQKHKKVDPFNLSLNRRFLLASHQISFDLLFEIPVGNQLRGIHRLLRHWRAPMRVQPRCDCRSLIRMTIWCHNWVLHDL